ncbi:hypothetical protein [Puniceibacterium sp. IMCC21224]|uniref:hypothetical protein n=1 Tax=Puniceibacterium sp. IMCC21224 TaxID=1618204 RepID=UPI00065D0F13|nr:hypothetical protein [Puniceibacterium sp. IMCC21224]KMK65510.1 hypothetical protein IMCC21224_11342 [Puniceibacterium sp. IMCC21224]
MTPFSKFRIFVYVAICSSLLSGLARAEQLSATSPTIRDSLCVGMSCAANESFGLHTTLRLKATTTRLEFLDTSTGAVEAGTDWTLQANDNAAPHLNRFMLRDASAGLIPFSVEAGAPDNAFWLSAQGRLGLGTSLPMTDMHLVHADSAALRLQVTPGDGPVQQSWDLLNTGPFALHDASAGRSPFEVAQGAPAASLFVGGGGHIGLGTPSPTVGLHLLRSDNSAALLIEETGAGTLGQLVLRNNGTTFFSLENTAITAGANTGRAWNFQNQNGTFRVTTAPGGPNEIEMILTPAGDMTIKGDYFSNSGTPVPDYVFDAGYLLRPLSDVQRYIELNRHLPDVPSAAQIAQTGHNLSQMQMVLLQKVEELTLYTIEQQRLITDQQAELAELRGHTAAFDALAARIEQLEN